MSNDSELDGELYLEIHGFIGLWLVELQVGVLVTTRGERNHLNQEISQHPFFLFMTVYQHLLGQTEQFKN